MKKRNELNVEKKNGADSILAFVKDGGITLLEKAGIVEHYTDDFAKAQIEIIKDSDEYSDKEKVDECYKLEEHQIKIKKQIALDNLVLDVLFIGGIDLIKKLIEKKSYEKAIEILSKVYKAVVKS